MALPSWRNGEFFIDTPDGKRSRNRVFREMLARTAHSWRVRYDTFSNTDTKTVANALWDDAISYSGNGGYQLEERIEELKKYRVNNKKMSLGTRPVLECLGDEKKIIVYPTVSFDHDGKQIPAVTPTHSTFGTPSPIVIDMAAATFGGIPFDKLTGDYAYTEGAPENRDTLADFIPNTYIEECLFILEREISSGVIRLVKGDFASSNPVFPKTVEGWEIIGFFGIPSCPVSYTRYKPKSIGFSMYLSSQPDVEDALAADEFPVIAVSDSDGQGVDMRFNVNLEDGDSIQIEPFAWTWGDHSDAYYIPPEVNTIWVNSDTAEASLHLTPAVSVSLRRNQKLRLIGGSSDAASHAVTLYSRNAVLTDEQNMLFDLAESRLDLVGTGPEYFGTWEEAARFPMQTLSTQSQTSLAASAVIAVTQHSKVILVGANAAATHTVTLAAGTFDRQKVRLVGTSDTNMVTLLDSASNMNTKGGLDLLLKDKDNSIFLWDAGDEKWTETERNVDNNVSIFAVAQLPTYTNSDYYTWKWYHPAPLNADITIWPYTRRDTGSHWDNSDFVFTADHPCRVNVKFGMSFIKQSVISAGTDEVEIPVSSISGNDFIIEGSTRVLGLGTSTYLQPFVYDGVTYTPSNVTAGDGTALLVDSSSTKVTVTPTPPAHTPGYTITGFAPNNASRIYARISYNDTVYASIDDYSVVNPYDASLFLTATIDLGVGDQFSCILFNNMYKYPMKLTDATYMYVEQLI